MSYCEDICEASLKLVLDEGELKLLKRNFRPPWLKNPETGKSLEYDFYLPRSRVGIEIQGPHHYLDDGQIVRDSIKRRLSMEFGVTLLELSIIQISPLTLYSKLRRVKTPGNSKVRLNECNPSWNLSETHRLYKTSILERFGHTEATTPPKTVRERLVKVEEERFFNSLTVVEVSGLEGKYSFEGLSESKKKVVLRKLGTDKVIHMKRSIFKRGYKGFDKEFNV